MQIAERQLLLRDSNFVRILRLAAEAKGLISLGPGEPDFDTPKFIRQATKNALDAGKTHYSSMAGRPELREAIAKKFRKDRRVGIDPDKNIIVTCGSNEAIFLGLMSILDPGEEVLVPDPCFLSYIPTVEAFNAYPISIPLKEEDGFQLYTDAIEAAIKDPKRVRAIVLSSPSNPTGTVLKKKRLEELADIAIEHDFLVFMDEAYEKLVYEGKYHSMASLNGMENHCVTFQTFSKSYAMPGYRLGYAVGPEELIKAMTRLHTYTTLTAPTMSQIAGYHALTGSQGCVERMRREYDRRRKLVVKRLGAIPGFELVEPDGAFYAFPSIHFKKRGKKLTSGQFCEFLLKDAKVLAVPGTEFGRYGEGFIRLSYATEYSLIKQAFDRIEESAQKL
ncbi:MAG: pyridoxal phosphate-dependent aminotransferase [Candidatus Diapherotrites archaeon]|nr:pyridoxal phosphate-dependent aminotransferase [Candidatus Diapherotrites archaeon]